MRLRAERLLRMAPSKPERDSAKFVDADNIVTRGDKHLTATGSVVLRQRGAIMHADRVDYDADEQTAVATGHVQLERGGDTASGPRLLYHLDNDTGEMETPVFQFPKTPERKAASRGSAERAALEGDGISRLFTARYTSCPVPRNDWYLSVRELEIDSGRNVGTAYNSTVVFLGVPILYTPWMTFPLDNKRKSGFLAPTLGTSGKSGFEAALPYYWNIADNMDATLTPKIFTKRGIQLGTEFRYLEPTFHGQFDSEYLPSDRIAQRDRWFLGLRHDQKLFERWHWGINAQSVSDDQYFRDLSTKIALTSQTNLPRDMVLGYGDDTWAFSARTLAYQTLQDPNSPTIPIPYKILPQLQLTGAKQNVGPADWTLSSELSNFRHPSLVNGQRFIVNPEIAFPFRRNYGYVEPRIGYWYSRYNLGANANGMQNKGISLPISSVDAGLFFDRDVNFRGRDFQQTLEPRLYYLYVPFRDQSGLPNFTTAERDFNFSQMFTENRFVGGDRVGDANQVAIGLTSRMIESATGLERLTTSIGQVYYFTPPRVTLSGLPASDSKNSDLLFGATSQMSKSTTLEAAWQYTPNLGRSEKLTVAAHYLPVPGSIINAAYRYARGTDDPRADPSLQQGIKQVDLSAQWPITRTISALGRWNWSVQDHKLVEGLAGFEYNAGCWQLRAVAHRFVIATQQYSTSFQIQLELTGLSRIGINPLETLRQNIAGYRRTDEITP
ncbi:MAG TPA: LPS-assembly protein LptD [Usitatibacter sp.]|nr:LPS-assembly protein LptD [Usitatibacter sp.]